jgi:hypothetical protein
MGRVPAIPTTDHALARPAGARLARIQNPHSSVCRLA